MDTSPILVDAHVHFHPCFDPSAFFDSANENFSRASRKLGFLPPPPGILVLTESAGHCFFRYFKDSAGREYAGAWVFQHTCEDISLRGLRGGELKLILVAGRQLVTAELLEILALGCEAQLPDGQPIEVALREVRRAGGLPVVPWGFGKWWFRRGRVLAKLLREQDPSEFFLGDNGGRPRLGLNPPPFNTAKQLGIRILPGTDPLPFPNHSTRVGSFGFVLRGTIDYNKPAEGLKALLKKGDTFLEPYGAGERLLPFIRNQVAMQLRQHHSRLLP